MTRAFFGLLFTLSFPFARSDIGVHIDGFTSVQAQTLVVQAGQGPVTGKAADAIQAARTAFDAALRLMRPGHKISEVARHLNKIAETYGCQLVEGVMSHEMKQFVIDGNKCVLNRPSPEQKVEDGEFEENEVYAIDIVVSTGEGKTKVQDEKQTTIFKRALDTAYSLKLKAARAVFSIINRDFPSMPFTTRSLVEVASADKEPMSQAQLSLGIKDCVTHGLLHAYPVLYEKAGEVVTQIKGTVLLMPNGSDVVTKAPAQAVQSEKKVEDSELLDLLAAPIKKEKKKVRVFLVVYHFAALRFNCLSACCLWTYVSITKVLHVAQGRPEELV
jgi:curved DNA binding protein